MYHFQNIIIINLVYSFYFSAITSVAFSLIPIDLGVENLFVLKQNANVIKK